MTDQIQKQSKCLLTEEEINETQYKHPQIVLSFVKKESLRL